MFISELTGRALLRNMRLLAGLRAGPPDRRLRLAVCGHQSGAVAAALRALEPGLDISESGDGRGELGLASLSGASLDSVIVTQPYHSLRSRAQLAGLQAALHVEEGTLGLLWARAMPSEGWVADYSRGIASVSGGSSSTSVSEFPLLGPAGDPLVWIDELGLTASGFQPPKHRKFIEVLEGACGEAVKTGIAIGAAARARHTADTRPPSLSLPTLQAPQRSTLMPCPCCMTPALPWVLPPQPSLLGSRQPWPAAAAPLQCTSTPFTARRQLAWWLQQRGPRQLGERRAARPEGAQQPQ